MNINEHNMFHNCSFFVYNIYPYSFMLVPRLGTERYNMLDQKTVTFSSNSGFSWSSNKYTEVYVLWISCPWLNIVQCIQCFELATILLTKTTAAQNKDALSYLKVRVLYYLVVVFVATISSCRFNLWNYHITHVRVSCAPHMTVLIINKQNN